MVQSSSVCACRSALQCTRLVGQLAQAPCNHRYSILFSILLITCVVSDSAELRRPRVFAGLHLHNRMPHILMPDELKAMHPTRRLRPYVPPTPAALAEEHGCVDATSGDLLPCGTYHWGSLLRIDVLEAPVDASLLFYGTGAIQVRGD